MIAPASATKPKSEGSSTLAKTDITPRLIDDSIKTLRKIQTPLLAIDCVVDLFVLSKIRNDRQYRKHNN